MEFKTKKVEKEWSSDKLSGTLKNIVNEAAKYADKNWNWDFVLTSIRRTAAEDKALDGSGIHVDWRAVDVRTSDQTKEAIKDVTEHINDRWAYDPTRPNLKVCFSVPHGTGPHAHFQVHPNTKLRNADKAADSESSTQNAPFQGAGIPLDADGVSDITNRLGVKAAELWAVIDVETYGYGFIRDRRPLILFERHKFSEFTKRKYDSAHPDISHEDAGGYGKSGAHQYDRLEKAVKLSRAAALKSASWGIGQVMGMNFKIAGYKNVEDMVTAMVASEFNQLNAMANFILVNKLDRNMRLHDWAGFARRYNGSNYAINKYDTRLAAAYSKRQILLPDMTLRAAQIYLIYLGYTPGRIDGLPGPNTTLALNHFQNENGLKITSEVTDDLIDALQKKIV